MTEEAELVRYIEGLSDRHLPPTRDTVRNFASTIAKNKVSESWVTRFINRNNAHLISKWATGIDQNRHNAESIGKYELYFQLLQRKMDEYNLVPRDTYNMDEKGFMIGIVGRSKRVFSKSKWESKAVRQSVQDGNREWITLMACVCADGTALPPSLIYPSAENSIRSAWVDAIQAGEHEVFVSSLPTGWTNDAIGLAWLEQVFDRYTKLKSGRSRRLLILDGHGSHVTMDFIKYCDRNRILLAILPPHSTQTLQPLDVALFAPLSAAYSKELSQHLERAQGLIPINKGDFFKLFWRAWGSSFKTETTLSSFAATGISPLNPDAVLKKFTHNASTTRESSESSSALSVNDWRKMDRPARSAVKDQSDRDARKLRSSLHHICSPNTNFSIFGYPFQRPQ